MHSGAMKAAVAALLCSLLACSSDDPADDEPADVVGPFTGTSHRFVVDELRLPSVGTDIRDVAADLNGDFSADNQAGQALFAVRATGDGNDHAADMIAAGTLASFATVIAGSTLDDDRVGFTLFGAEGEPAVVAGGRFVDGVLTTNRTKTTRVPGEAVLYLPVFADIDPLRLPLIGMEAELAPDGDGAGGYTAIIRGALPARSTADAVFAGIVQMVDASPNTHRSLVGEIDRNHDFSLTRAEFDRSIFAPLLAPDLVEGHFPRGGAVAEDALSFAVQLHLAPCAEGNCALRAPADACFDRVRDGDETDVDCGGGCRACPSQAMCAAPADCQTGACDAGRCALPTCSDGVQDGFEVNIDCGGNCPACPMAP